MEPRKIYPRHAIPLLLILCGAAIARWHKIDSASFYIDESLSLEVSAGHGYEHENYPRGELFDVSNGLTDLHTAGSWGSLFQSLTRTNHPPLYFCVLRAWRMICGSDSDIAIRSLSALASLLTVLLAFDAARLLHGNATGLACAAVIAFAGTQIQYAQDARPYALLIALMLAACDALLRIQILGFTRNRAAALFVFCVTMPLTHYLGFAVLAAMLIYALVRLRQTRAPQLIVAAALLVLLCWGPTMLAQRAVFTEKIAWINESHNGAWLRDLVRLCQLPLLFLFDPGRKPSIFCYASGALFLLPIFFLRRRPEMLLWCLIMWIVVGIVAADSMIRATLALTIPRYTLPAATAGCILIPVLLAAAAEHWNARARALLPWAAALACVLALPNSYERDKPDVRTLAQYLNTTCRHDSALVFYNPPAFDWFSPLLDLDLSHYTQSVDRPTAILSTGADQHLIAELRRYGVVDVVFDGEDLAEILPGCRVLETETFPFVGACARIAWTDPKSPPTAERVAVAPTALLARRSVPIGHAPL